MKKKKIHVSDDKETITPQGNDEAHSSPVFPVSEIKSEEHNKQCDGLNFDKGICTTFLQILSKEKSINVACERALVLYPEDNTIKWSEYLNKLCQLFPRILKCNNVCAVSFLNISV